MWTKYKLPIICFISALLGVSLALSVIHIYNDHKAHHGVINFLNQQIQQANKNVPQQQTPSNSINNSPQ